MIETDTHVYFWGDWASNFDFVDVKVKTHPDAPEITLPTSEHAFMLAKALSFNDFTVAAAILTAKEPKDAKALGRSVAGFDKARWDNELAMPAMFDACWAKFSQNAKYGDKLLATGSKIIVEGSPVDRIWGVGIRYDNPRIFDYKNWEGPNQLGLILMHVRHSLRQYRQRGTIPHYNPKIIESWKNIQANNGFFEET